MKARERASVLRARLFEIRDARRHEKHAEALEDKREALEHGRSALQAAVESAAVLIRNGCLEPGALPDSKRLDEALANIAIAFSQDPGSIAKGRNFSILSKRLEATTKEVAGATTAAWKREIGTAPKTNESLLDRIARLPGQSALVAKLRSASRDLEDVLANPPGSAGEWADYRRRRLLVEEQVKALSTDRFPKAVLDFCIAAQSDGARLSMLTEEVRAWLKEYGMLDDLRYRM